MERSGHWFCHTGILHIVNCAHTGRHSSEKWQYDRIIDRFIHIRGMLRCPLRDDTLYELIINLLDFSWFEIDAVLIRKFTRRCLIWRILQASTRIHFWTVQTSVKNSIPPKKRIALNSPQPKYIAYHGKCARCLASKLNNAKIDAIMIRILWTVLFQFQFSQLFSKNAHGKIEWFFRILSADMINSNFVILQHAFSIVR